MDQGIKSFRDLKVWRKAHGLAGQVFVLTEKFPREYLFDLTAQLRRAALSVPTNLAEGSAASSTKELLQFVSIAKRSASETQYLLLFASERRLLTDQQFSDLDLRYDEVGRMLSGLKRSLNERRLTTALARH